MTQKPYPTDLTDAQRKHIKPFVLPTKPEGRPRKHDMRDILEAVCYFMRTGCTRRMLQRDFPPWRTVYEFFAQWRGGGTQETMNARLREQIRRKAGRPPELRIAAIDGNSVKANRGGERGFTVGQ